jgi:hypothetical protein
MTIAVGDRRGVSNTTNELSSSSWGLGGLTSNSSSIKGKIIQLGGQDAAVHPIARDSRGELNGRDKRSDSSSIMSGDKRSDGSSIRSGHGGAFYL